LEIILNDVKFKPKKMSEILVELSINFSKLISIVLNENLSLNLEKDKLELNNFITYQNMIFTHNIISMSEKLQVTKPKVLKKGTPLSPIDNIELPQDSIVGIDNENRIKWILPMNQLHSMEMLKAINDKEVKEDIKKVIKLMSEYTSYVASKNLKQLALV
jgi:hypothetical protein